MALINFKLSKKLLSLIFRIILIKQVRRGQSFSVPFFTTFMFLVSFNMSAQMDIEKEIDSIMKSLSGPYRVKGEAIARFTLEDRMSFYNVPGISVAIVKNGNLWWAKG